METVFQREKFEKKPEDKEYKKVGEEVTKSMEPIPGFEGKMGQNIEGSAVQRGTEPQPGTRVDVERQKQLDSHTKEIQEQQKKLQEGGIRSGFVPGQTVSTEQIHIPGTTGTEREIELSRIREQEERERQRRLEEQMSAEEKETLRQKRRIKEHLEKYGGDLSLLESGSIPNEMKCLILTSFGGTKNINAVKMPHAFPGRDEVLIRARSCGMNFQDIQTRQGLMDHTPKTPFIMGGEVAGDVVALGGNVYNFKVGDRVIALPEFKGWGEFVVCPVSVCYKLPENMDYHDAIAITMNGIVAYSLLFELGCLRPGKSILIHSAAGGVGQMVAQMARSVNNVTLFGIASGHKEGEMDVPVDHFIERGVDYVSEIRRITPVGVDLVLDCQCGDNFQKGYNLLKPMGKYILYGTQASVTGESRSFFGSAKAWWGIEKVSPLKLYDENKSICGFNLRHLLYFQRERGYVRDVVNQVFEMWQQGNIKPVIDSVFAFEDFADAMHRMQEHGNIGKIILDPTLKVDSKEAIEARAKIISRCFECEPRVATKAEAAAAHSFDKGYSSGVMETLRETFTPRNE